MAVEEHLAGLVRTGRKRRVAAAGMVGTVVDEDDAVVGGHGWRPGSTRRESKRPGRGTRMGRRAGWPGRRCTSHEPSWVISIRRSAVVSISTGLPVDEVVGGGGEAGALAPVHPEPTVEPRCHERVRPRRAVTTAPLFDQRASCAVPPKAGPCLVHVRRSGEVATQSTPVVRRRRCRGRRSRRRARRRPAGPRSRRATRGPATGRRREQHRLGVERERDAVIAHRQAEAGGPGEGSLVVLGSEEQVDLARRARRRRG